DRLLPGRGQARGDSDGPEDVGDERSCRGIVVDDEDRGGGGHFVSLAAVVSKTIGRCRPKSTHSAYGIWPRRSSGNAPLESGRRCGTTSVGARSGNRPAGRAH